MRCLKFFGDRITARDPDRQTAEIHIRIALMNHFIALGTAGFVRLSQPQRGTGQSCLRREMRKNAEPE
ncbi:hypothetical protein PSAL_004760 [Pseudooceanicola algae]|uniref:Transposase DDE domain-containing protein n=1 Tax=Pseudooceanicola algae TaxID=1537215 RepID=A0A418SF86_9RHOB|nr:hypothetical protein PSAL_004760 [Pseudooceanicola algae]